MLASPANHTQLKATRKEIAIPEAGPFWPPSELPGSCRPQHCYLNASLQYKDIPSSGRTSTYLRTSWASRSKRSHWRCKINGHAAEIAGGRCLPPGNLTLPSWCPGSKMSTTAPSATSFRSGQFGNDRMKKLFNSAKKNFGTTTTHPLVLKLVCSSRPESAPRYSIPTATSSNDAPVDADKLPFILVAFNGVGFADATSTPRSPASRDSFTRRRHPFCARCPSSTSFLVMLVTAYA